MAPLIHPTALIDPSAELHPTVEIGPFTIVGPGVRIGRGTRVGGHATLMGPTEIGEMNVIHGYAVVGTDSQDMKFQGGQAYLRIGNRNVIREFVTINRATEDGTVTEVGDDNRLLAYTHVAHNCRVGNRVIMSNVASLAGHVVVEDDAVLGGLVAVHQFCRIGRHSLVGAGAKVVKDIPPYCVADGVPARLAGINAVGLRRRGFGSEDIDKLRRLYLGLFRSSGNLAASMADMEELLAGQIPAGTYHGPERVLLDFIRTSRRGVARVRRPEQKR